MSRTSRRCGGSWQGVWEFDHGGGDTIYDLLATGPYCHSITRDSKVATQHYNVPRLSKGVAMRSRSKGVLRCG